jgi:hypothetical protein
MKEKKIIEIADEINRLLNNGIDIHCNSPIHEKLNELFFSSKEPVPKYVSLNGVEMRLKGKEYWRDAGLWGVKYKIKNGKIFSSHRNQEQDWLDDIELIPITEDEWRKANKGYV